MAFFQNYFNKVSPEKFFLFIATGFGLLFLSLTPPFQVPDEPNHFYRAWQVSEGGFFSVKQDKRIGGYLPSSLERLTIAFFYMPWSKKEKMQKIPMGTLLKTPLNAEVRRFYDFNNTAMYSPVCYLPAATALFICRLFDLPPLFSFYSARVFTLFFWIWLVYVAIRLIPVFKWLFTFLALLPMSLFTNMSISADVVTNAVCFLFIAAILRWACSKKDFDTGDLLFALLLIFLLSSVKSVYACLILLLLVIPKNKFKDARDWILKLSLLLFSGLVFTLVWNYLLNASYISYEDYNPDFRSAAALVNGANMHKQIEYILHHGSYIFHLFIDSFRISFDMYFNGYIGMFGWLETNLPPWFVYCAYASILVLAIMEGNKTILILWWQKLIIGFTFVLIFLLVFLSQHLIWDPVGYEKIQNIQGRYLIPFTPLLFILFYNRLISANKAAALFTILSVLLSLVYSIDVLYSRYY